MDEMQIVAFELADNEYAVDILNTQEIIRPTTVTRVPKAPHFISGVINLRGNVIPVVDLRTKFNLAKEEFLESTRIIILNINDIPVGIIVDSVNEVITVKKESIEEPDLIDSLDGKYVKGVIKQDNRLLILLNIAEILELTDVA